ncbi:MAG TPA: Ig-like domain-containing protein [Actinomycetota bacterium]
MRIRTLPRAGGAAPRSHLRVAVLLLGALAVVSIPLASSALAAAPAITAPADGSIHSGIAPATVRIAGTSAPSATVAVTDATAGPLGSATADANGNWSLNVAMTDGSHTITAVASDADGASPPSTPVTFEVDAVRPAVQISSPDDGHAFGAGEPLVIQGSASDERTIHAIRLEYWRFNELHRAELATCESCGVGSASEWYNEPPLEPGYYQLKAYAYDAAGNRSSAATRSFLVSGLGQVPIGTPELPPVDGAPEVPTLLEPDEGEVVPGEQEPVVFSGATEPGSTVEVKEEVQGLGTVGFAADDDEDGHWEFAVELPTGRYGVRTRSEDDEGNLSPWSDLIGFEVDAQLPSLANLTGDETLFLPTQDIVIEGSVLDDRQAVAVVLEYWLGDERVLHQSADCGLCPATDAAWQHRPQGLRPGYYHVKVRAIDGAGQRSTVEVVTFTVLGL